MPTLITHRNQSRRFRGESGFTLIELAVVMLVIGILAAIAIPTLFAQHAKAYGAGAVTDLRNAATAETAELADYGTYSSSTAALANEGFRQSASTQFGVAVSTTGYCEVAFSDGKYWWYDSKAGLVASATTSLQPPAAASGSCATAAPSSVS